MNETTERGQAYTLEGFIGAMIVLLAVLFALQSVVITPTTGGAADRAVQDQLEQELQDGLLVASHDHEDGLSPMVRYWDESDRGEFHGATQSGPDEFRTYTPEAFAGNFTLGEILDERFTEQGWSYNVELYYEGESGASEHRYLVYQGSPGPDAVTASYAVSLYDDQQVSTDGWDEELEEVDDAAIPAADDSEYVYNVVEVRVVVW